MYGKTLILILTSLLTYQCFAQKTGVDSIMYKQVGKVQLQLEIHSPPNMDASKKYPAIIFFFGGGWKGGNRNQFVHHAKHFSQRGLVCFLADYRILSKHGTTPFDAVKDAKSAMRFIRSHAQEFGIDPDQIIASGGSAGGHLAAATATLSGYNDPADDLSISCMPNAMVLFNPVVDNGPGGYGYERVSEAYRTFSPLHNVKRGAPPTLFMVGTKDNLIPVETAEYFKTVMEKVGSTCQLILYKDQPHGFFNFNRFENYKKTVQAADAFLQGLGYLSTEPVIDIVDP